MWATHQTTECSYRWDRPGWLLWPNVPETPSFGIGWSGPGWDGRGRGCWLASPLVLLSGQLCSHEKVSWGKRGGSECKQSGQGTNSSTLWRQIREEGLEIRQLILGVGLIEDTPLPLGKCTKRTGWLLKRHLPSKQQGEISGLPVGLVLWGLGLLWPAVSFAWRERLRQGYLGSSGVLAIFSHFSLEATDLGLQNWVSGGFIFG